MEFKNRGFEVRARKNRGFEVREKKDGGLKK